MTLPPVTFPTLGWQVIDWIEAMLCHGPGDVQGEPLEIDDEVALLICWLYRVHPRGSRLAGRRLVQRGVFSRPKGRAKSEVAGAVVCAEALGPVRCDGFDAAGEPVGVPVAYPFIRCLATEEEQAGNTYDNVVHMLTEGEAANEYRLDVGVTRTFIREPGGGEIVPSTSGSASKDGGKESFAVADEPLALDTPIPVPGGWTTMGELQAGDQVFGVDGHPVLVWGVAPVKRDRECFRVTFDDGTSIVADAAHRWTVQDRVLRRRREATTRELVDANWYGKRRFAVPRPRPLELPDAGLLVDPWVLGMWLGDGDARAAKLAVGDEDLPVVCAELDRRGFTTSIYRGHCNIVRFNHGRWYGKRGTSQHALRELGVLEDKHVPSIYLRGSRQQRLDLLAGLMDSDGHVNARGNCTFTNGSRALCEAVVELARTFGWRACIGAWRSDGRCKSPTSGTWRVSFTPSGAVPFRLPRKAARCRARRDASARAIASIEVAPSVPVRCIAVDSDDHLFLAGPGMLPTHNTHLYVPAELRGMYRTVARNTGKRKIAEPWMLDTTTAWRPGERSIAEQAADRYKDTPVELAVGRHGVLYDHRQGDEPKRFGDDRSLKKALKAGYGPAAGWMDFDRIIRIIRDAEDPEGEAYRYWLNRPRAAASQWLAPAEIERVLGEVDVEAGMMITLGFDGSENDDHTALMGCTEDGDVFPVGVWTPAGEDLGWRREVDEAVNWCFRSLQVVRMYADPPWWQEEIGRWAARYGSPPVMEFWTNVDGKMAAASGALRTAIRQEALRVSPAPLRTDEVRVDAQGRRLLSGGTTLVQWHLENARAKKVRVKLDDRAEEAYVVRKERPGSPLKIDVVTSAILARRARDDAVKAGEFVQKTYAYASWR